MNPSTAQARVVIDELLRCGVTDFVLAPGSRSAALAIAAAQAEERGELVLHVRVDERVAGYLALGLAKATGVPAAIITTSGTSVANLLPSFVEADLSGIPLVALTADRPHALRGVGANQEIDQVGVLAARSRAAIDMAPAVARIGEVAVWRSTVARIVAAATDATRPGPVHLNLPFAEPLVPDGDETWVESLDGRSEGRPWTADLRLLAGMSTPLDDVLEQVLEDGRVPARGVIVLGDHADPESVELVDELADELGWPVIAEPSANAAGCATVISHAPLLLADPAFAETHRPELVISVGRVGLARPVMRLIASAALHIAVDPQPDWADPTRTADLVIASVPLPPTGSTIDPELDPTFDPTWLESWEQADVLAAAAVETVLAGEVFTGMHVARTTAACVPEDGLLVVGASWPVRHLFSFASTSVSTAAVIGNRGASGIDGCVSTAWGAALASQRAGEGATVALVGDLAFHYDSNALAVPEGEPRPDLVIVVSDNHGGGIFSQLEQAGDPSFERVFGTPLPIDCAALAESMGIGAVVVENDAALATAIDESLQVGGVRVVVARTCARDDEARMLALVQEAVTSAIARE